MAAIQGPRVEIRYYTDPLCVWSWAFEPHWRRFREEVGDRVAWQVVMGGMIADWASFSDPMNDIRRPAQMAPHWFHVAGIAHVPVDPAIWHEDPPDSSYPACIAVKAAESQGFDAGEAFLRRVRGAVMLERRNIARREVLLDLADELGGRGILDPARFREDLVGPEALEAFRDDLKDARYRQIGRFPTVTIQPPDGPGLLMVGYRTVETLRAALERAAPGLLSGAPVGPGMADTPRP